MRSGGIVLCVLALALIACQVTALATGVFSGSFSSQVGLDLASGSLEVQTESTKTLAQLAIDYKIDTLTLFSISDYDFQGLSQQVLGARGSIGLLRINSRLSFAPLLGGSGSTIVLTKSINNPTHQYNLGQVYFVDQVQVTALTLNDNINTTWRVRTSPDGSDWTWVSGAITGNSTIPVVIPTGDLCKYVEIVASSGFIDESSISAQVSGKAFVTTVGTTIAGVSLSSKLAIATGGSSFSVSAKPGEEGSLLRSLKVKFSVDPVTCVFGYESADVGLGMSFGCVEEILVDIGFDCDSGFSELELSALDIKTGLSWVGLDLSVDFSLTEKLVSLLPSVELDTVGMGLCITPYIQFVTDTMAALGGLELYGIRMSSAFDGVTVESLSYLDDIHHTKEDYWEKLSIAVDGDTCCGGGLDLKVTTHFSKTSHSLFGWAETELDAQVGLGERYLLHTYLSFTPAGIGELIFGVAVTW